MKKRTIKTTNRDIYNKLNMLNFNTEVIIKGIEPHHINKIINNINKHNEIITMEQIGDNYILLKRKGPINYNTYYVKR